MAHSPSVSAQTRKFCSLTSESRKLYARSMQVCTQKCMMWLCQTSNRVSKETLAWIWCQVAEVMPLPRTTCSEIHWMVSQPSVTPMAQCPSGTYTCNSVSLIRSCTLRKFVASRILLMVTLLQVLATTIRYTSVTQSTWRKYQSSKHSSMKTKSSLSNGIPTYLCSWARQQIRQPDSGTPSMALKTEEPTSDEWFFYFHSIIDLINVTFKFLYFTLLYSKRIINCG